jgi:hypothetical protein
MTTGVVGPGRLEYHPAGTGDTLHTTPAVHHHLAAFGR